MGPLTDVNDYPENLRSYGHSATGALRTNCNLFARTTGSCVAVDSTISNIPIKSSGILQTGNRRLIGLSATGGADAVTYFISSEYQKEQNVVPSNGLQRMNIRTNLRSQLARPRRAAQHRLHQQRAAASPERQQLVRRRLRLDARQRRELLARAGPKHASLCGGGTDTVSFGYYNRGFSPYDFFNIDAAERAAAHRRAHEQLDADRAGSR